MSMINQNAKSLKFECLNVLDYYLAKTRSIMRIYKDTSEIRYFLFALKGTKASIDGKEKISKIYLNKCIDTLIDGQKDKLGSARLVALRNELEEELSLLKLRYNLE